MITDASSSVPECKTEAEEVEGTTMAEPNDNASADAHLISNEDDEDTSDAIPTSNGNAFVWALTISACVSGLLFGYDTGVISSTLVSIGTDLSNRSLTTLDKGLITSSVSAFALVASPIAGVLADKIGRKNIIIFSDVLFIVGALWQAVTGSVWAMIMGRSIVGLAIGGASLITPLYISELAPSHIRGRLVTVSLLFITGGQVVAYVVGWLFSSQAGGWRWMVGLGAAPAVIQVAMLVFMPETPRYLCKIDKEQEARAVLMKVYHGISPNTDRIVNDIIRAINREITDEQESCIQAHSSKITSSAIFPPTLHSLLFHPPHRRALTITCMLQGLQQLCGFNSLMYFSATIFSLLRFASPTLTSLSIATTNFIFTVVAFYLIDRIGRRRMLLLTIPIMAVALLLCAAAFGFVELPHHSAAASPAPAPTTDAAADTTTPPPPSSLPALAILTSLLLYVSAYATALGPVPWQQSELFPLHVRSLGSSLATATNWGSNTLVGLMFLPMMDVLGAGWTFVGYAGVCAVGWVCVWGVYPETMGMGLEEIGGLLREGYGVKKSVEMASARRKQGIKRRRPG